ncbi:MAG TPA: glycosyltransferase family 2 protein [Opitutaceae bacterium]|nr:glycosyltransferase family 2 protein [Opitutaceae bacterium]
MSETGPTVSIVIPLYRSEASIERVVAELAALRIEGGLEIVLVNDCSPDDTLGVCRRILATCAVPVTVASHARNFGEHNAVLTGLRHTRGRWVVTMDDDGQNPPTEVPKLLAAAQAGGFDVVFGDYRAVKEHAAWRNWGSAFTNAVAGWLLDKPAGLYLSSFRCLSRFIVDEIVRYEGPYPYIDGLILQCTRAVTAIPVAHKPREQGQSGYNLRRLVRLWLNMFTSFSVAPLRAATVLGLVLSAFGAVGIVCVVYLYFTERGPEFGWGSLMAALLLFSGAQLVMLGVIGEYLGRAYLTANRRPQSVVRDVWRGGKC